MIDIHDIERLEIPFLLSLGNSGKITKHMIMKLSRFDKYTVVLLQDRGLVIFKGKASTSKCGQFYTDVNAIKINKHRIKYLTDTIAYYEKEIASHKAELEFLNKELQVGELKAEFEEIKNRKIERFKEIYKDA